MTLRLTPAQTEALRSAAASDGISMHTAVIRAVEDYTSRRQNLRDEVLTRLVNRDREALDRLADL